ncbi:MAG: peptidase M14 [Polyangiaceae bacterium]|nr:peptidase M14 [Polyangiaceae bacterium]
MSEIAAQVRARLEALSRGFRSQYLRYADLEAQLAAWAEAFPEVVRLTSLAKTNEGRDIWMLTVGKDPDRVRPAAWVDGNMHASELAGSSAALSIAEDAIALALGAESLHDVPAHLCELLRNDVLFYIVPRLCPDGAEHMLTISSYVRSNPRDTTIGKTAPYWRGADIDGDGRARIMRVLDPGGQFALLPGHPDWLVPREIDDPGPYYSVYPEGYVENWDGQTIPAYHFLSDNLVDLNRNFPFQWAPEPRQEGAGLYPLSEPESRALVEFAVHHPNIFAWLNLHTYGGCYIRPSGHKLDRKMNPEDLWVFQQIERFATPITGYPIVSGYEEFTYEPDTPLCGDLATFAYEQRGAVAMVCELWDFWKQVGFDVRRPFVGNYVKRSRADMVKIVEWDRAHNASNLNQPYKPYDHPQLGRVEIGGYDPLVGVWNPPLNRLAEVCQNQARAFLRWAALSPRLTIGNVQVESVGDGIHKVSATVQNIGFLPTNVLATAKTLPWNDPVRADIALGPNLTLLNEHSTQTLGHLSGWSPDSMFSSPVFARTTNEHTRARVHFFVRGTGAVTLSAGCARTGRVSVGAQVGEPSTS